VSRKTDATNVDSEEFRDVFLRRGWRGIERNYGVSSDVLHRLIVAAGGDELLAARAALQGCGRRAGSKP
jgi:hypothetical protein